uniref:Histone domain-containing protein n=1 Tax=Panagrellus redivivus TaxID=6233 RepID=A0A7E4VUN4_PANRE
MSSIKAETNPYHLPKHPETSSHPSTTPKKRSSVKKYMHKVKCQRPSRRLVTKFISHSRGCPALASGPVLSTFRKTSQAKIVARKEKNIQFDENVKRVHFDALPFNDSNKTK